MGKTVDAPNGVTEAATPRNPRDLQTSGQLSGWRKPSAGIAAANRLAEIGEHRSTPKTRAFVAVKRVGAHIGLRAADMMLLDTLGAFTQAQDWQQGQRPIVWASNAYLIDQTGFSLSALKRHARRLAELGVLSFHDSPNGKRWGRRDADGRIVEAYGFDLSPLSVRVEEFEALYAEIQANRERTQRLKRQITIARRTIRARINAAIDGALQGPWTQLADRFGELMSSLPLRTEASDGMMRQLNKLKELQNCVEAAYLEATHVQAPVENPPAINSQLIANHQQMDPKGANFGPHILTTKELKDLESNGCDQEDNRPVEPISKPEDTQSIDLNAWVAEVRKKYIGLDLPTIMQACPEFTSWARNMGGYLHDWGDLHRIASQLRPMIGVTEHAWNVTQERLGKQVATAAFALVFEKHCAGEVSSPGGYLRGMVTKAGAGELHLERSFFGRLGRQAA
ncbi:MAG: plasmid replication protein RepC [Microcystis sp. LE19-12.2C]|nr:plasmid replication protein RepC [Microcystis sp. LE19-12.2C]